MTTILQRGDLVACPYCQTNQGVPAEQFTTKFDQCIECDEVFHVRSLFPGSYSVERTDGD